MVNVKWSSAYRNKQLARLKLARWITLWSKPNERFAGYVREVSPAADQSRTFTVKVALKEGQSAIQLGQSARVFLVRLKLMS